MKFTCYIFFALFCISFSRIETFFFRGNSYFLDRYPITSKQTDTPIDISTAEAKNITLSPIILKGEIGEKVKLENNGNSVTATIAQPTRTTVTGGVLKNQLYKFFQIQFYWTNDIDGVAGTTIDGENGTPLEIVAIFIKAFSPIPKAVETKDEFAVFRFRAGVTSPKLNVRFIPLAKQLKKVQYPGNSTFIPLGQTFAWFDRYLPRSEYYAYPGAYVDAKTGKKSYSATEIVFPLGSPLALSQFRNTFGSLKNSQGEPLTNVAKQAQRNRPVIHSIGAIQLLIPRGTYLLRKPPF